MTTIWINAGELSGDMQAAALLRALHQIRPDLRAVGMGGPLLAGAGQHNLLRVEDLSVMGIAEVITAIPRALNMLGRIRQALIRLKPAAVILVDAPEFNFRVASMAHRLNIPVYYFIPPKVWAWRTGRVRFLREHVRRIFSILPFEQTFYESHGLTVDYVGNPLVDMVAEATREPVSTIPNRIGLMPGSRRKETENLMPLFAEAAKRLLASGHQVDFHCLRAPNMTEFSLRSLWPADIPITFLAPEDRYQNIRSCAAILAASGTAVLETALLGVPTVVTYKVSPFSAWVGKHMIKVPWVSLPNLIMQRPIFPELLQEQATPEAISSALALWLDNAEARHRTVQDMEEVRRRCGEPGSAHRAAQGILRALEQDGAL